jgi:anti-anti-sigma factor
MAGIADAELLRVWTVSGGGMGVVAAAGELDIASALQLRAQVADARGVGRVASEMAGLWFIDAAGLGALAALATRAEWPGAELLVGGVSRVMTRILAITGSGRCLPVAPSDLPDAPDTPAAA